MSLAVFFFQKSSMHFSVSFCTKLLSLSFMQIVKFPCVVCEVVFLKNLVAFKLSTSKPGIWASVMRFKLSIFREFRRS